MKLVTAAKVKFNKLTSGGFQRVVRYNLADPTKTVHVVLGGEDPGDVREMVKRVAMDHGESQTVVDRLIVSTQPGAADGVMCFADPLSQTGMEFSHYAEVEVFPALNIEGRFFRLNEIEISN